MGKNYTSNQKEYLSPEMKVVEMEDNVQLLAGTLAPGTGGQDVSGGNAVRGSSVVTNWDEEE